MNEISAQLNHATWSKVSDKSRDKLRLCIVANVSVALAGPKYARLPAPDAAPSGHFLFSGKFATNTQEAASFNATLMHARNQDDFHPEGRLHVGTIVIPTALAVAQSVSASGLAFLDSIVAGYTAGVGISSPHATFATQRGFRATGVFGPFAAAATAARGYGLGPDKVDHAMAIASSMAGGLNQCWVDGSDEWQLHASESARAGIHAVRLALAGCKGARHAFFGNAGFVRAFAGVSAQEYRFDADRAVSEIVIKRYSVSGINQSIVFIAERLARQHQKTGKAIRRIRVGLHETDARYPGTANATDFRSFADRMMSAAFCCASVFNRGRYEFGDMFATATLPERDHLIPLIAIEADASVVPFGCRVDLETSDGQVFSDAMTDPECDLAVGWSTVDDWAIQLWAESGRDASKYHNFKEVVMSLDKRPLSDFIRALA